MFVRVKKIGNHEYMYLVENARYAVRGIASDMPPTKLCRTDLEHQLVVAL
jgi:hypothetical protein